MAGPALFRADGSTKTPLPWLGQKATRPGCAVRFPSGHQVAVEPLPGGRGLPASQHFPSTLPPARRPLPKEPADQVAFPFPTLEACVPKGKSLVHLFFILLSADTIPASSAHAGDVPGTAMRGHTAKVAPPRRNSCQSPNARTSECGLTGKYLRSDVISPVRMRSCGTRVGLANMTRGANSSADLF